MEATRLPSIDEELATFKECSEMFLHYIKSSTAKKLIRQQVYEAEQIVKTLTKAYRVNENLLLSAARCFVSFDVELRQAKKVSSWRDLMSKEYTNSASATLATQELLDRSIALHDRMYNVTEQSVAEFMSTDATGRIMAAPIKRGKRAAAHQHNFVKSAFDLRMATLDGFALYDAAVQIVRDGSRRDLLSLAEKVESERERIKKLVT